MAKVLFYEKPGCINNTRQKRQLLEAGHQVIARNLLTASWTEKKLRPYFGNEPVNAWFNPSAPEIKQGVINPSQVNEQQAIDLMLENFILIRRPLMQISDIRVAGFDQQKIDQWIGLKQIHAETDYKQCPREQGQQFCDHE